MTIEEICFLNIEDIAAIRVACGKCDCSTTMPINKLGNIATLIEGPCSACGEPSGVRRDTDEWNRILKFVDALGSMAGAMKGRNVRLSLRIECPQ